MSGALFLLHDGSAEAGFERIAALLPAAGARLDWNDASVAATLPADATVVLAFDWLHIEAAVAWQERLLARGAAVYTLGFEPGSVTLGPWVLPGRDEGCLECLRVWTANNHREPTHWATTPAGAARRLAQSPWPPIAEAMLAGLLEAAGIASTATRRPGRYRRLDWDALTVVEHRFSPYTECWVCAAVPDDSAAAAELQLQPRLKARAEDARIANPRLSREALRERFVDRRSGQIQRVFHDLTSSLSPMFGAEMPICGSSTIERGFGRAATRPKSETIAMLELLERYCGHSPRAQRSVVRGSFEAVQRSHPGQVVDPLDFVLHEAWQYDAPGFEMEPYSPALEFDWCWAFSLREQRSKLVPQQLAYYWLPHHKDRPVNRFVYDSSSGCALGGCIEEAILHGLYETLERDAYLTRWWGRLTPRPIRLESIGDAEVQALLARSTAQGYEVHLFDMRLDIDLPMALAMIVDPRPDAPVKSYCASAASGQWTQAIFGALVEVTTAMAVYSHTLPKLRDKALSLCRDPQLVQEMHDHVIMYSAPESFAKLGFMFGGEPVDLRELPPRPSELDLSEELRRLVDATLRVAKDVLVVRQGYEGIAELGLDCAKVIAPGLTPVTFGQQARRVSVDRVNGAARSLGLPELTAAQLNPDPHNFP